MLNYDEITPEDEEFVMDIVDRTDFNSDKEIFNGDEDASIEIVDTGAEIKKRNEQDETNKGEKNDDVVKKNMENKENRQPRKGKKNTYVQRVRDRMEKFKEEEDQ